MTRNKWIGWASVLAMLTSGTAFANGVGESAAKQDDQVKEEKADVGANVGGEMKDEPADVGADKKEMQDQPAEVGAEGKAATGQQGMQQDPMADSAQTDTAAPMKAFQAMGLAAEAIQANQVDKAQRYLTIASQELRPLYTGSPGEQVLTSMDVVGAQLRQEEAKKQGKQAAAEGIKDEQADVGEQAAQQPQQQPTGVDFAPLMTVIRQQAIYMDPKVVAEVEGAEKDYKAGRAEKAAEKLRLARERLVADVALLPVEDAYARTMAAKAELEAGRHDTALRLLQGLEIPTAEVTITAPMVAARFDLRAAAAAAEAGNWEQAQQLLDRGAERLQMIRQTATKDLAKDIKPIADQAQKLSQRFDEGKQPKARDLKKLAKQAADVEIGT